MKTIKLNNELKVHDFTYDDNNETFAFKIETRHGTMLINPNSEGTLIVVFEKHPDVNIKIVADVDQNLEVTKSEWISEKNPYGETPSWYRILEQ